MTDNHNFFIFFNMASLKVVTEEFSKLKASLIHFKGVLHSVGELIISQFEEVFTVAELRMKGLFLINEVNVFVHFLEAMDVH